MKIKVFLWQIYHRKLQAAAVLKRRGWKGDHHCSLCGKTETINHIFVNCPMGTFIWCCIRDVMGWEGFPISTLDFLEEWLPVKFRGDISLGLTIFAGLMWATWRNMNKMTIEKKIP